MCGDREDRGVVLGALCSGLGESNRVGLDKLWRMYLETAEVLVECERYDEAAIALRLSFGGRQVGGWAPHVSQRDLGQKIGMIDPGALEEAMGLSLDDARRRGAVIWRGYGEGFLAEMSVDGKVVRFDPDRGFGFVRLSDGRTAFVSGKVAGNNPIEPGRDVRVIVADGWDRKKRRKGLIVARLSAS